MLDLLRIAAEIADPSTDKNRKAFIGAVSIRKDGTLVYSRNGGNPHSQGRMPSVHAEARVLRKSGYGATVYVARVLRNGQFALAKPCGYCQAVLRARKVEMVYYTTGPNSWEGFRP